MNCEDFAGTVNELVRGTLSEATARESALAHANACPRCAARLSDERTLSAGFRALAADAGVVEAPTRVEAALLARLRERAATIAEASNVDEVETGARVVALKHWSWAKTLGTAATATALAAAAAVLLMMLLPAATPVRRTTPASETTAANQQQQQATTTDGAGSESTVAAISPSNSNEFNHALIDGRDSGEHFSRVSTQRRMTNRVPATPAVYKERPMGSGASSSMEEANETAEITTDFISLGHASRLVDGDGGQLVRVELPRSALVRFGLPMNVEHSGERIKADVLMGEDGIARAIRFVR